MSLETLTLHRYLDLSSSPLGAALGAQPLMGAGIDGNPLDTLAATTVTAEGGQRLQASHAQGLMLTVDVEPDPAHAAVVWHLTLAQSTGAPGPRLHDLRPLQLVLDGVLAPDPVIHTWRGGAMQAYFPPDAATPQSHVVYPHTAAYYHPAQYTIGTRGGRSSDQDMPYVLVTTQDDSGGMWIAIGWSGHWTARFRKPKESADLHLTVQIAPCDLRLPAGVTLRGPSMALGLYHGDYAAGCNALRRWLRARMPALPGDGNLAHFNTWTAMDADVDEARLLAGADRVAGHGLRYFMLDAGWYPSPPDNFSAGVGTWRVDEATFPRGLEPVAERVRSHGMQMGLWIEPERAHLSSEVAREHPDWLLTVPGRDHALVNFAHPEVRRYFREVIADFVERLDLGWLKWDFNLDPLPYWEAADDGGLAHLGHIAGVWETFDWLRSTFPALVIENCASGGNRLDWTLFSRALTNFANDQYTQPDCMRRILGRMAAFLPTERLNMIFGPYQRRPYGDDAWQVLMGSAFGVSEPLENWTDDFVQTLRRHLALHHATDAARTGDFYRLTTDTPDLRAWEGWQMHVPQTGAGVICLWRSTAAETEIVLGLHAIDPSAQYRVTDLYHPSAEPENLPGDVLASRWHVSLMPMGAALRTYQRMPLSR